VPPVNQACAVLCIARRLDAAAARWRGAVRGGEEAERRRRRRGEENDATPLNWFFFLQLNILYARPCLLFCIIMASNAHLLADRSFEMKENSQGSNSKATRI
jgi:hypothetical protein